MSVRPIEIGCKAHVLFFALFFVLDLKSAPGDVQLDILTVTGDAAVGPGGNAIGSFEVSPSVECRAGGDR